MKQKAVYQTDRSGFFLYSTVAYELMLQPGAFNVPFGAVEKEPPATIGGQVARIKDNDWEIVEDHRGDALYLTVAEATEDKPAVLMLYAIGSVVSVDGVEVHYDGGGPVPDWLSNTVPAFPSSVEPRQIESS